MTELLERGAKCRPQKENLHIKSHSLTWLSRNLLTWLEYRCCGFLSGNLTFWYATKNNESANINDKEKNDMFLGLVGMLSNKIIARDIQRVSRLAKITSL